MLQGLTDFLPRKQHTTSPRCVAMSYPLRDLSCSGQTLLYVILIQTRSRPILKHGRMASCFGFPHDRHPDPPRSQIIFFFCTLKKGTTNGRDSATQCQVFPKVHENRIWRAPRAGSAKTLGKMRGKNWQTYFLKKVSITVYTEDVTRAVDASCGGEYRHP